VFTSGWASGINAYAVVLLLGVFGATGISDEVPASLQRTDVLVVAGALFLCEAVADKIPYVDSLWDSVHTVIRPVAGAVVAALLAGQSGSLPELAAGAVGGSTALMSHLVKAGTSRNHHVRDIPSAGCRDHRCDAAGARHRDTGLPGLPDPPVPAPQGPAARGETPGRDGFAPASRLTCQRWPLRSLTWHVLR
jgi:hypothetical protein